MYNNGLLTHVVTYRKPTGHFRTRLPNQLVNAASYECDET